MSKEEPIYPSSIASEKLCREAIEKSTRAIVDSEMNNEIKDDISIEVKWISRMQGTPYYLIDLATDKHSANFLTSLNASHG